MADETTKVKTGAGAGQHKQSTATVAASATETKAAPPPPEKTETPGQATQTREAFDAQIDVSTLIPTLARNLNLALSKFGEGRLMIPFEEQSVRVERVHEEGWLEAVGEGEVVKQIPLNAAHVEALLSQIMAALPQG
jgi:hypothetical protein